MITTKEDAINNLMALRRTFPFRKYFAFPDETGEWVFMDGLSKARRYANRHGLVNVMMYTFEPNKEV